MVVVRIKILNILKELVGDKVVIPLEKEGATLREVLERLCGERDDVRKWIFRRGEISQDLIILINGVGMNFLGYENAKIKNDDEILILPAIAGGIGEGT
jgi:molybdopterin converting factor small subunit